MSHPLDRDWKGHPRLGWDSLAIHPGPAAVAVKRRNCEAGGQETRAGHGTDLWNHSIPSVAVTQVPVAINASTIIVAQIKTASRYEVAVPTRRILNETISCLFLPSGQACDSQHLVASQGVCFFKLTPSWMPRPPPPHIMLGGATLRMAVGTISIDTLGER